MSSPWLMRAMVTATGVSSARLAHHTCICVRLLAGPSQGDTAKA